MRIKHVLYTAVAFYVVIGLMFSSLGTPAYDRLENECSSESGAHTQCRATTALLQLIVTVSWPLWAYKLYCVTR